MRMMIVVPALAEGEKSDKPVVGGKIAGREAARAPEVGDRVHHPGGMQADDGAQEDSPKQERQPADGEQHELQR